jgi:hypothetical protein
MAMVVTKFSYSDPSPCKINNTRSCSEMSDPMLLS